MGRVLVSSSAISLLVAEVSQLAEVVEATSMESSAALTAQLFVRLTG